MWKLTPVCWTGWTETIYIWILHSAGKYFEDKQLKKFVIFCAFDLSLIWTWMLLYGHESKRECFLSGLNLWGSKPAMGLFLECWNQRGEVSKGANHVSLLSLSSWSSSSAAIICFVAMLVSREGQLQFIREAATFNFLPLVATSNRTGIEQIQNTQFFLLFIKLLLM